MSDDLDIDALLAQLTPEKRARLAARLVAGDAVAGDKVGADKVVGDKVIEPQGTVNVGDDGRINGVAVGVNLGTIMYGRVPEEDERRWLVWYLDRLAAKLYRLPLRGLDEKLDQGNGVSLPQVYVMLALTTTKTVAEGPNIASVQAFFEDLTERRQRANPSDKLFQLLRSYDPDWALPDQAIVDQRLGGTVSISSDASNSSVSGQFLVGRARLATEAVHDRPHLVILGEPGGGKSTFLRHLAWALARRGLDQPSGDTTLFGWEDQRRMLPIIVPLRALAGRLAAEGVRDTTVYAALRDEIQSYSIARADDMLNAALHRGAVLLLFDGLDEVPLDAIPGVSADRRTTVRAVKAFTQTHSRAAALITCRVRAFDEPLRDELDWPVETIAPFTLGQIRHFIPAWYNELVQCGQIQPAQAERMSQLLLDLIIARPKLRAMAETPLLLTMMALVLYNKGELPRDRPQLYERILELLLGQWDKLRDGQSLAESIGVPDWGSERMRPLLDQLSFQAHAGATSADGRGRLARRDVRDALEHFLIQAGMRDDQAAAASVRCLDYFNHRSGLLVPDGAQDSYTFAHLTLQEHCAGRYIVSGPDAVELVLRYRADDRWREPILLGLGVVQQTNPALLDRVLTDLIDPDEAGQPKSVERWQRDLIFAAEIGVDRDWGYLRTQRVNVDRLQRVLKCGLIALLDDRDQPLPIAERVRAGFLLGDLGDLRVPVTSDEWRRKLAKTQAGDMTGYFCQVDAGAYTIGSADNDPDADDNEQPQHTVTFDAPFLIARYPVTNAQWQAWVQMGGEQSRWSDNTDLNRLNQPVVGVTWHMCNAFCAWLSEQLGATVRLPTEPEWEAAARGGDARRYPWGDEWQDDRAATAEDQETRGARYTVPVGCYPAGAAPCGVLDMAGNVWEWTVSAYRSYPGAAKPFTEDQYRVLRGGGWNDNRKRVRCGARGRGDPGDDLIVLGFRVVVAPRLAH